MNNSSSGTDEFIFWIDVEVNDRDPDRGSLLEIGMVPTLMDGTLVSPGLNRLVKIDDLGGMMASTDEKIVKLHEKSGLWDDLWNSPETYALKQIETDLIRYVENLVNNSDFMIYFGGNSVTLDRKFVSTSFPDFSNLLSHRSIDCTSIALMLQRNSKIRPFKKKMHHRAFSDAEDSAAEYRYYLSKMNTLIKNETFVR